MIQYDFAFSFAGEDRPLVQEIKEGLNGYSVFYDKDFESELCGKDLYSHLRNLYLRQTKFVVCFLSIHYKQKMWTNLEFSAVKERLMATFFASDFLIPIILDNDAFLEDIPSYFGFYVHENVKDTIALLRAKIDKALNEDIYLENILCFRDYLLQEVTKQLGMRGIMSQKHEDSITYVVYSNEKIIYLLAEDFSNLPCLLLYEYETTNPPSAIIAWKRSERLLFSWNAFMDLEQKICEDIPFNELIDILVNYLLCRI